ncbi:MAG: AI-2E family transporter [Taibaiella sp.]|nr:AI-2E family transporter [Taibaiella sp.]
MNQVKLPFYARLALILISVVLIFVILKVGSAVFIPLLFALLIAVLVYPVTRLLERMGLGRSIAALITILAFFSVVAAFIYLFILQIISFSKDLPRLQKRLAVILHNMQSWISHKYGIDSAEQMDYVNKSASSIFSTAAHSLSNIFLSFGGILIMVIFIIIYSFFILYHRRLLTRFVTGLFKPQVRSEVHEVVQETRIVINSYVIGLMIEMAILAVVGSCTLAILGIQYAILIGVLAAVLNIIPYIGIYTSIALSMLITFTNGGGKPALEVALVLLIIHIIDSNIMMPRIVGGRVKMNPFITIVAVIVGELIWGIPGMFLFIPLTAIIKIISERVEGLKPWAILIGEEQKEQEEKILRKSKEPEIKGEEKKQ